jgi:hypothetical protein
MNRNELLHMASYDRAWRGRHQREIAEIMTRWRAYQAAQNKPAQT